MTEPQPEPTLADVITAINNLAGRVHALEETSAVRGMMRAGFVELAKQNSQSNDRLGERITREFAQLREDVLGLKTDQALTEQHSEDLQEAMRRHLADPDNHHRHAA